MSRTVGRKHRLSLLAGSVLVAAITAPPVLAQSAGDQLPTSLSEVVVTATHAESATKTDTPIVEIPQTISVVTAQQITVQGAPNLQDALHYTAGFDELGNDSRGDFFQVRSFQPEIYVDGLKRNFGFVYLPRIETYTMDRLETLVGPAAVLYGAGSAGGLVDMESKRPEFDFGGEVAADYGTWDRKQVEFDVTGPITQSVAARVEGVYLDSDMQLNYIPNDRRLLEPSVTWKPNGDLTVTLIGLYQQDYTGPSQAYLPITASLYAAPGRAISDYTLIGEPGFNKGPKTDASGTLLIDYRITDSLLFHSATRVEDDNTTYNEIFGTWSDPLNPFTDADQSVLARAMFAYRAHYHTVETDDHLLYKLQTGLLTQRFLAGFDHSDFQQTAIQAYQPVSSIDVYDPVYGNVPAPAFGSPTTQNLLDVGAYAQDQLELDRVSLVLGLRHDHSTTENTGLPTAEANVMTYRAGLSVNAGHGLWPYVSYAESFDPISGLNQFNQSYVPLYGKQYETGVKWQPAQSTLMYADVYDITERNELIPDPTNPVFEIQAGKTYARGFEFQANQNIPGDMSLSLSYSHNSTRQSGQSEQQNNVPKDVASVFATRTFTLQHGVMMRAGGGIRYVGSQVANDAAPLVVVTPSVTLVDAVFSVTMKQWELQFNALNLFNTHYYASCSAYGGCFVGDRRTINGTFTYRFW